MQVAGKRGYTLIEVIVALLIISVVAGGLLSALMMSMRETKEERERVIANILAESTIDELLARPPGTLGAPPGWKDEGTKWTRSNNFQVVRDGMNLSANFQMTVTIPSQDTAEIKVQWTESTGPKELDFQTTVPYLNRSLSRTQPTKVQPNWHEPPSSRPITTDPDLDPGHNQHDVPQPPNPDTSNWDYSGVIACDTHKANEVAKLTQYRDQAQAAQKALDPKAKDYAQKNSDIASYITSVESALSTLRDQINSVNDFLSSGQNPSGFSCMPDPGEPTPPSWFTPTANTDDSGG